MPAGPNMSMPLGRGWNSRVTGVLPPMMICHLEILQDRLKNAFKLTTEGKFAEALKVFVGIIHSITLLSVEDPRDVEQVEQLLKVAREYACALRIEIARKEVKEDQARQAELAAYFTHAELQPVHLSLSLRSAMSIFFKMKNYATASTFCRRLLELNPPVKVATQAKQVLQACERAPKDELKSTTTLTIHSLFAPPLLCRFTEGQKIVGVPHVAPTMSLSKRVMCVKCVT